MPAVAPNNINNVRLKLKRLAGRPRDPGRDRARLVHPASAVVDRRRHDLPACPTRNEKPDIRSDTILRHQQDRGEAARECPDAYVRSLVWERSRVHDITCLPTGHDCQSVTSAGQGASCRQGRSDAFRARTLTVGNAGTRRVGNMAKSPKSSASAPETMPCPEMAALAAAFLDGQQITMTQCGLCGTEIAGVNGRYSCGVCGWTNPWWEGTSTLPSAEDDVQT